MTVVPTAPATPATPLKLARVARGWRQTELARIAGLHRETVSRAEAGEPPTLKVARALSHTLDVPLDELFPTNNGVPGWRPGPRETGEVTADAPPG